MAYHLPRNRSSVLSFARFLPSFITRSSLVFRLAAVNRMRQWRSLSTIASQDEVTSLEQKLRDTTEYASYVTKENKELKDFIQETKKKTSKVLSELLISIARRDRQVRQMNITEEILRLNVVVDSTENGTLGEVWDNNPVIENLKARLNELDKEKQAIELSKEDDHGKLANIKIEEQILNLAKQRYEYDKNRLQSKIMDINNEQHSEFSKFRVLKDRYLLLNLLGKGGFGEVFKAFDLEECKYVACKFQASNGLSVQQMAVWCERAVLEFNTHKKLSHPNIVGSYALVFDGETFCSILEYCGGKSLDSILKETPILPENEAKLIIFQIFQALVYMNSQEKKVIHYDLKPANILFDEIGIVKLTDFGISKILSNEVDHQGDSQGGSQGDMELTQPGVGTFWYLPPECFIEMPRISSKVDVWSCGVLLFQMLFGKRPFGHDQSQHILFVKQTILKARHVDFPSSPAVSVEAKDFIRRCLTYDQAERPDVLTAAADPYLLG